MAKNPIRGREVLANEDRSLLFSAPVETGRLAECDGYLIPGSFYLDVWAEGLEDNFVGRIHFKVTKGDLHVSEITFRARPPLFELHDYSLNDLPLKSLTFSAWRWFTEGKEKRTLPEPTSLSRKGAQMKAVLEVLKEIELLDVAIAYCHEPSKGTQLAMDQMGYKSRSTASLKVRQAREKGLIPPPGAAAQDYAKALRKLQRERESYETQD